MWLNLIFIILGLGLLAPGLEGLVRGSSSVARRLGITPWWSDTIVAFNRKSRISCFNQFGLEREQRFSIGNVIGSNISNIGLILGCRSSHQPYRSEPK